MHAIRRAFGFALDGAARLAVPVLASLVLGTALLAASSLGAKWLILVFLGGMAAALGLLVPDPRLFLVTALAACIPIGFQYNLWSHGSKFAFIDHFGGALAEPVIHLVDIPIAALMALWILDLRLGNLRLPPWTAADTLIVCLLAACLPSLYVTEEPALFAFEFLRYLKYLAVYWVLRTYLDRAAFFWGILGANVAVLSLQGLVSLLQYFLFFQFPIPVGGVVGADVEVVGREVIQRVTGILGHSNTFAAYLSAACSMGLILLLARIGALRKLAAAPFLAAGLLALALTFSRNGWMVFALDVLLIAGWAWRTRRLSPGLVLAGACLAGALAAALAASGVMDTAFTRIFRTDSRNFDSRWDLIGVAWEMIKSQPLAGIGLNAFEESMIRFDPQHITHVIRQPVHNGFLLVAAETGLPALAFLLALAWLHLRESAGLLRRDTELHFAVGLAGLAVFGGLGVANLFDVTLRKESVAGLIVVTAAMVSSLRRLDGEGEDPDGSPGRRKG